MALCVIENLLDCHEVHLYRCRSQIESKQVGLELVQDRVVHIPDLIGLEKGFDVFVDQSPLCLGVTLAELSSLGFLLILFDYGVCAQHKTLDFSVVAAAQCVVDHYRLIEGLGETDGFLLVVGLRAALDGFAVVVPHPPER